MTKKMTNKDYHELKEQADNTLLGVPEPNPEMVKGPFEQPYNTAEESPYKYIRSEVLGEAESLVNGQRQADYGTPQENMDRIATMFQILFPEREWKASDIPLALLAVKFGRACQGYTRDTAVDMAGYASLWAEISEVDR